MLSHVVTSWQDDQRGSLENTGALAHGEDSIVWSLHGSTPFDDGVSIDGPMHRPDVFKMQSVRHTPACIPSVGGMCRELRLPGRL